MNLRAYTKYLDSAETGRNIRAHRKHIGMSTTELARRVHRSKSYVSRIESGERKISPKMIKRIEGALAGDK